MVGRLCLSRVSDDFVIRLFQSFVSTCQRLIFRTETTTEYSLSTYTPAQMRAFALQSRTMSMLEGLRGKHLEVVYTTLHDGTMQLQHIL